MALVLTGNRYLRFFSFTVFYVAQGLPFGLANIAIPAYLAEQGVAPAAIAGFITVAALPWLYKGLAGPVMDRFTLLAMGRRRPWVILSQAALVLTASVFVFFPDGLSNVPLLTALFFLLNSFSAVQDVAVDGMAIDVLPPEEHGHANAFMAFGQVLGISGSAAIGGVLVKSFGMLGIALMLLIGFGLILTWAVAVREREGEKLLPWTEGAPTARSLSLQPHSLLEIVGDLLKVLLLPASLLLAMVSFLFRFADGLWVTVAPVIVVQQQGFLSEVYSRWTALAGLIAATVGLLLGHFIDRKGVKTFYIGALLLYALLAVVVGSVESAWSSPRFLLAICFVQAFIYQAVFISFIAIHMKLCWVKVSATQFALYMTWINVGRTLGTGSLAVLDEYLARNQLYFVIAGTLLVAVVLLVIADMQRHQNHVTALDNAAAKAGALT
ncbi:MAG: MFS transporter [Gammaproteobacteria bacterium]|nr:MFS transporter [Gammaproteobacteria bacterium]